MRFSPGDRVLKNPFTWIPSEFDAWGAGEGVGIVVEHIYDDAVDVRWPSGRCYQKPEELLLESIGDDSDPQADTHC